VVLTAQVADDLAGKEKVDQPRGMTICQVFWEKSETEATLKVLNVVE
jgi:hypothetical protein